jgi:predicted GNAT superfamily acetyltransferase
MRLGARPVEYLRDYYGSGEDSALSAGIGTDRFVVRWELASERAERALGGEPPATPEPAVRVEIPGDIQAVRDADRERAAAWRASTRQALEPALARGDRVEAFVRTEDGGRERYFYLLTRCRP